jgi:hypothetical protein
MRWLISLSALWFFHVVQAQNHSWAEELKSSSNGVSELNGLIVDDSSDIYIFGNFNDTLYLPTDTFFYKNGRARSFFIAKYDKNGQAIWAKSFSQAVNVNISGVELDSDNQLVLLGTFGGATLTLGKFTLNQSRAAFIAFLNEHGTFTGAEVLGFGSTGVNTGALSLDEDDNIFASVYFNGFGTGWRLNSTTGQVRGSGFKEILVKYDSTGRRLDWRIEYDINSVDFIKDIDVDNNGDVYYLLEASGLSSVNVHGTVVNNNPTFFVIRLRNDGSFAEKATLSVNGFSEGILSIEAIDSNEIYITGRVEGGDSLLYGQTQIKTSDSSVLTNRSFNFLARLDGVTKVKWYRSTNFINPNNTFAGRSFVRKSGQFLFFSSTHFRQFSFGSLQIASTEGTVCKVDTAGNVLWILPVKARISPLASPIGEEDVIYSGSYTGTNKLEPFTLNNPSSTRRPFLARTFDYKLSRGEVSSGPYCAGDTILIPYDKEGVYDTSNIFKAELSDENGEFTNRFFELGSLKTTEDSVIKGLLPLFQVASSANYRIRVVSTNPVVQSFFRLDTLNLLIYSRDKADPGPDSTICLGDTIQLNTFGGTTWTWSPAYNMDDSTLRQPRVWPEKDTVYTIIIGDSSGCGAPDTADIRVSVRSSPEFASSSQSKQNVCKGELVRFDVAAQNGTGNYSVKWLINGSTAKNTVLETSSDSLFITVDENSIVEAYLTDSCSILKDTIRFRVKLFAREEFLTTLRDTTVCLGTDFQKGVKIEFSRLDSIRYTWESSNGLFSSVEDSLFGTTINQNDSIKLLVENLCLDSDTVFAFSIGTFDPLRTQIQKAKLGDSLCIGESLELSSTLQGGFPNANYTYKWSVNGRDRTNEKLVLTSTEIGLIQEEKSLKIAVEVSDGCTKLPARDSTEIFLRDSLKILKTNIWASQVCQGQESLFKVGATGGIQANYAYNWSVSGFSGNTDSFVLQSTDFQIPLVVNLTYSVNDGCSISDSIVHSVEFLDSLRVELIASEVCMEEEGILTAIGSGGNESSYQFSWLANGVPLSFATNELSVNPDDIATYEVIMQDGCSESSTSDSIRVSNIPTLSISKWDTVSCPPFTPEWQIETSNSGLDLSLNIASQVFNQQPDSWPSLKTGIYSARFSVANELGCTSTEEFLVRVKPLPNSQFVFNPETVTLRDPRILAEALDRANDEYSWFVDGRKEGSLPTLDFLAKDPVKYSIKLITTLENCIDSSERQQFVEDYSLLLMPTAFSPDGDGTNDQYQPYLEGFDRMSYTIYGSWGQKVFEGNESTSWDGNFNGSPAPIGSYLVIIKAVTISGVEREEKLVLQLLR